ncbi:class I SAM-dependent methyltransferase [Lacipirellula limnantheis]|uniref:Uncharacterized protein n=1 Tax=Lacipirellula limnantheis TaxID=2528024 RepID=A0A517TYA2_9BACT|nr:hypothetical protein I41_25390 [Lacipirellula limnantheis]
MELSTTPKVEPDQVRCAIRFRSGEWRATIFRDLVVNEIRRAGHTASVLDIGCGHGFDGDKELQDQIGREACQFIGVEPDPDIEVNGRFGVVHRHILEESPIRAESIDVAYATMVLEHLSRPAVFFDTVERILRPGGVFWGFTVDRRHYFCAGSRFLESIQLKDAYLNWFGGRRGVERYENYPTYYRCNSPSQLAGLTRKFSSVSVFSLSRPGQIQSYVPRPFRPLINVLDWITDLCELPGHVLVLRCQK